MVVRDTSDIFSNPTFTIGLGANRIRLTDNVYTEMEYLVSKRVYEKDIRNANAADVLGK